MMSSTSATPVWLRRFTKFTAFSTLFLIFAGAMVTSTGSGLAVPDWPLAYGMVFPPMVGGIFYEHGHRIVATFVGFFAVVQAIWLQVREPKRFVRLLGWFGVGAVIAQGVLGGLTVLFHLPPAISISHAGLAQIFLGINVAIAYFTSKLFLGIRAEAERGAGESVRMFGRFIVIGFFIQILVGALMRHLGAGLAIPDFPLSYGKLIPPLTSLAVTVNFIHRAWGVILGFVVLFQTGRVLRTRDTRLATIYLGLVAAIVVQIMLGAATVWMAKQPLITSFHVVTGAATFALSILFVLAAETASRQTVRAGETGLAGEGAIA